VLVFTDCGFLRVREFPFDNLISRITFKSYSLYEIFKVDHQSLEIYCSVATELSITRAAKQLGRVQSNVSTRIQQLEEELGVALFLREGKRLSLTAEGERFLGYANRLLILAEEARQMLSPQAPQGILRLGSMESTAASRLPTPLADYHSKWPKVQLRISTGPSRPLLDAVCNGLLDCALVALPGVGDALSPQDLEAMSLMGKTVFREELLLLLPASHPPVTHPDDVVVRSLAAFGQGCSYRAIAEDWLADTTEPHKTSIDIQEMGSYHGMLACVVAGSCASLVPRSVLELLRDPPDVHTHPVMTVDTWLIWRRNFNTPAFAALRDVLTSSQDECRAP
jgi:DNA-binding transcriptional LysR family regulator